MCSFYTYTHTCGHTTITWVSHCKKGAITQQRCAWQGTVLADLEIEHACQKCHETRDVPRRRPGEERRSEGREKRSRVRGEGKERR